MDGLKIAAGDSKGSLYIYDVLPEVVLKNEEGEVDSVSYGRIVGVLIEAIKDLKKEIEDLKANK